MQLSVVGAGHVWLVTGACLAFLAMKDSYINPVANICQLLDADVTMVADGMGADPGIGSRFPSAGVVYGGACFRKDTPHYGSRVLAGTVHGF